MTTQPPYESEYQLECTRCHSVVDFDSENNEASCKCDSWVQFYRHDPTDFDAPLIESPMPKTWHYVEYKIANTVLGEEDIPFGEPE